MFDPVARATIHGIEGAGFKAAARRLILGKLGYRAERYRNVHDLRQPDAMADYAQRELARLKREEDERLQRLTPEQREAEERSQRDMDARVLAWWDGLTPAQQEEQMRLFREGRPLGGV